MSNKPVPGADPASGPRPRVARRASGLAAATPVGANLRGKDLRGACLVGLDLRAADLRGADLRGADLRWARLEGADLTGADLRGAILADPPPQELGSGTRQTGNGERASRWMA
jgi:Pentapeptide repeats (8 copies)